MSALELAWASIEADAWTRTLYLAKRVLSAAISTSTIRPLAAIKLVSCLPISSPAKRNLDIDAPLSARKVETFSIAWVNTPTDMSDRLIVSLELMAAKVIALPEVKFEFSV